MNTIYTAGYAAWTLDQLAATRERLDAIIVDIRANPTSTRAEWRKHALIARFGSRYKHLPELGNRNYFNGGPIELAAPHRAVSPMRSLLQHFPVILLCACRDVQSCHRNDAATYLGRQLETTIEHLEPTVEAPAGMIKALTLTQPWATLVAIGVKKIETRSWSTTYRGLLAIHAAQNLTPVGGKGGLYELCMSEPFYRVLDLAEYKTSEDLPRGAIVAIARLVECVSTENEAVDNEPGTPWFVGRLPGVNQHHYEVPPQRDTDEYAFGDYSPGRYAWLLADVKKLDTPIPARGGQGLWNWQPPEEIL